MENPSQLKNPEHGSMMAAVLASNLKQSSFADVKIVCPDGSAWAHRLVLAAVSPVLKSLLLSVANDDVATLYLPQLSVLHLNLVLDYVYKVKSRCFGNTCGPKSFLPFFRAGCSCVPASSSMFLASSKS